MPDLFTVFLNKDDDDDDEAPPPPPPAPPAENFRIAKTQKLIAKHAFESFETRKGEDGKK